MTTRTKPKLTQGAINKRRWGYRARKRSFQKRMAAAVEVHHRRTMIAEGTLQTDDFNWNKQFIPWWQEARKFVLRRDRWKCRGCGAGLRRKKELPVHHIVPRKYGGDENPANLISLCESCHKRHEMKLAFSGLFDTGGNWRRYSRKELLIKCIQKSGLRDIIVKGPPKATSKSPV